MQARAVFEAAAEVMAEKIKVKPEIMIPLVGFPRELQLQIDLVHKVAAEVAKEKEDQEVRLHGRHDDRNSARLCGRGRNRPERGVLSPSVRTT